MGTEECGWGESALYLCDLGNAFWLLCQVQIPRFSISAGTQSMTHLLHLSLNSSEARTLPLSRISPRERRHSQWLLLYPTAVGRRSRSIPATPAAHQGLRGPSAAEGVLLLAVVSRWHFQVLLIPWNEWSRPWRGQGAVLPVDTGCCHRPGALIVSLQCSSGTRLRSVKCFGFFFPRKAPAPGLL